MLRPPAPYRAPWILAALGKHITYCVRDDLLNYFFYYFLKTHLPKVLNDTSSGFCIFGSLVPHFCKESRIPTMLMVLSLRFIITPVIYPLFKMCHLHKKISTFNQLIKIGSSSINYLRKNGIIPTY